MVVYTKAISIVTVYDNEMATTVYLDDNLQLLITSRFG